MRKNSRDSPSLQTGGVDRAVSSAAAVSVFSLLTNSFNERQDAR